MQLCSLLARILRVNRESEDAILKRLKAAPVSDAFKPGSFRSAK